MNGPFVSTEPKGPLSEPLLKMKLSLGLLLFLWSTIYAPSISQGSAAALPSRHKILRSKRSPPRTRKLYNASNHVDVDSNGVYGLHGYYRWRGLLPPKNKGNIRERGVLSAVFAGYETCGSYPCQLPTANVEEVANLEIRRGVGLERHGAVKGERGSHHAVVDVLHRELLLTERATSVRSLNDLNATGLLGRIKAAIVDAATLPLQKDVYALEEVEVVIKNARRALEAMGGQSGPGLQLTKVTAPLRSMLIPHLVSVREEGVFGVSVTDVVFLCSPYDESDMAELGGDSFAIKIFYKQLHGLRFLAAYRKRGELRRLLSAELGPLKLLPGTAGVRSERDALLVKGWNVPLFAVRLGRGWRSAVRRGDFVFGRNALLYEAMVGDASLFQDEVLAPHLPRPVKYYICKRMIETVAALHVEGMCHYNINPKSFSVRADGTLLLADFAFSGRTGEVRSCNNESSFLYQDPTHAACVLRRGRLRLSESQDAWAVGVSCYSVFLGGRLPHGLNREDNPLFKIASLASPCYGGPNHCRPSSQAALLPPPKEEMRRAGIGEFWASLVALLLTANRSKRPLLRQIVAKFEALPLRDLPSEPEGVRTARESVYREARAEV